MNEANFWSIVFSICLINGLKLTAAGVAGADISTSVDDEMFITLNVLLSIDSAIDCCVKFISDVAGISVCRRIVLKVEELVTAGVLYKQDRFIVCLLAVPAYFVGSILNGVFRSLTPGVLSVSLRDRGSM